jgi:hypothetical protein
MEVVLVFLAAIVGFLAGIGLGWLIWGYQIQQQARPAQPSRHSHSLVALVEETTRALWGEDDVSGPTVAAGNSFRLGQGQAGELSLSRSLRRQPTPRPVPFRHQPPPTRPAPPREPRPTSTPPPTQGPTQGQGT